MLRVQCRRASAAASQAGQPCRRRRQSLASAAARSQGRGGDDNAGLYARSDQSQTACAKAHAVLSRDELDPALVAALACRGCGRVARPPAPGEPSLQAPRRISPGLYRPRYRAPKGALLRALNSQRSAGPSSLAVDCCSLWPGTERPIDAENSRKRAARHIPHSRIGIPGKLRERTDRTEGTFTHSTNGACGQCANEAVRAAQPRYELRKQLGIILLRSRSNPDCDTDEVAPASSFIRKWRMPGRPERKAHGKIHVRKSA